MTNSVVEADRELSKARERRILQMLAKVFGLLLGVAAALWIFWRIREILPPFLIAFLLAVLLAPIVDRLEARKMPRWAAATLVYLLLFGTFAALLYILIPLISHQIGQVAADLRGKFRLDQPADISRTMTEQIRIFGRRNAVPAFILQPVVMQAKNSAVSATTWLDNFGRLLVGFIPNLIWFVLVPVIGFYALVDYNRISAKVLLLFPKAQRDDVRAIGAEVSEVFGKYLRGLLMVCLLDSLLTICVLLCFPPTRPYAAALGLIAGLLYAVPYLGAIVSTSLIALVAFAAPDGGSITYLLWVTLSMVLLHQVLLDQIVSPRLLGGQVGLHPILSVFALLAGNTLLGVGGMLLAVPAAASIQVVVLRILPRLARKIEVDVQPDAPEGVTEPNPAHDEARKTDRVEAGDGVVGTPHTVKET